MRILRNGPLVTVSAVVLLAVTLVTSLHVLNVKYLNRELIKSIQSNNFDRALTLLREGASASASTDDVKQFNVRQMFAHYMEGIFHRHGKAQVSPLNARRTALNLYYVQASELYYNSNRKAIMSEELPMELVKCGAPCNQPDEDGFTPLIYAAELHHDSVLLKLLQSGANVNASSTYSGQTALMLADAQGTRILLNHGANMEAHDTRGRTALFWADTPIAKVLLDRGARINAQDKHRLTALMCACYSDNRPMISLLLAYGARVDVQTKFGGTALLYAAGFSSLDTIKQLIRAGADVRQQDRDGNTALMLAVHREDLPIAEHLRMFRWLISQNINVNARGTGGNTVLDRVMTDRVNQLYYMRGGGDETTERQDAQISLLRSKHAHRLFGNGPMPRESPYMSAIYFHGYEW